MFNHYAVRPVGSDRFFDHLKDVQARSWYDMELPEEPEDIARLCEKAHAPWKETDVRSDPWQNLYYAILINAMIDYLDEYEAKLEIGPGNPQFWVHESRCLSLENGYFRDDDFLSSIFDKLLVGVCWAGVDEIRRCRERLKRVIGWVKRPDCGKGEN